MTFMLRYCRPCNRAFAVTEAKCPGCGEQRDSTDAITLIEKLGDEVDESLVPEPELPIE